jgi:hypothetical protein
MRHWAGYLANDGRKLDIHKNAICMSAFNAQIGVVYRRIILLTKGTIP